MQEQETTGDVKPHILNGKSTLINYPGPCPVSLCDTHGDIEKFLDAQGRYVFIDIFGLDQDLINVLNGMPNEY
jgi:hypothetical protein